MLLFTTIDMIIQEKICLLGFGHMRLAVRNIKVCNIQYEPTQNKGAFK